MYGTGPLSRKAAGEFNFDPPPPGSALYLEPTPKRIRVRIGGETVADLQPVYYFPPDDVRTELLEPTDRHTHCPKKGDASYYTIRAGSKVVPNGAWYYPQPLDSAPPELQGLVAFYFDRVDQWLEEAEEIGVHPRDPYHRIDVIPSDSHVRVSLDGKVLASSRHPLALFESGLPVRWYLPREDVVADLQDSDTVTHCPYKGEAHYWSVDGSGGEDLIWHERVEIEVDGVPQERPSGRR